jgi:hypothetical protein
MARLPRSSLSALIALLLGAWVLDACAEDRGPPRPFPPDTGLSVGAGIVDNPDGDDSGAGGTGGAGSGAAGGAPGAGGGAAACGALGCELCRECALDDPCRGELDGCLAIVGCQQALSCITGCYAACGTVSDCLAPCTIDCDQGDAGFDQANAVVDCTCQAICSASCVDDDANLCEAGIL